MFKIQEVRELIKLIDSSNIDEFEYKKRWYDNQNEKSVAMKLLRCKHL